MWRPPLTVVETPTFKNKAHRLLTVDEWMDLIAFLAQNPEAGPEIQGTGGVRKVRWAREDEGKRGAFRVIYYYYNDSCPLFAITLYQKGEKDSLTQAEKNAMRKLTAMIVSNYKGK